MEYQDALINEDQNGLIDDNLAEDVKLRLEAGLTQTGETDEGNLEWIGTRDMWIKYERLLNRDMATI